MPDHAFYSSMLRFVAARLATPEADPRTKAMMAALRRAADDFDTGARHTVAMGELELTARAFAGVAGFLQRSILPEALAHGNTAGERQVRWAVDAAMTTVNTLLARAALPDGADVTIDLPPPPV